MANNFSQDKQVSSVYLTKNFDRFKSNSFNREVKESRIKTLMESMQRQGYLKGKAIVVNEKWEIIDGHTRFYAARELGIPFYFEMWKGISADEIANYNQYQDDWGKLQYTLFWSKKGNENYKALKEFLETHPKCKVTQALVFLMGEPNAHPKTEAFQNGEFKVKSVKKAEEYYEKIERLAVLFPKAYGSKFISAIIACETRSKDFNFEEFYTKLKKFPDLLTPSVTTKSYLEKIDNLYNYHRKGKKVNLANIIKD